MKDSERRHILPNIWTSGGILGTFITLVFSIAGVDSLEKITGDITFIKNFITAFTTSIVGICGSISVRFFIAQNEEDEAQIEIDTLPEYEKQTERYYLYRILETLKPQADQYRDLSEKLSKVENAQNTTNTKFESFLDILKELQPTIKTTLDATIEAFGAALSTSVTNMTQKAEEKIDQNMKELIGRLAGILEATNTQFQTEQKALLEANKNELSTISTNIQNQLTTTSNNISQALQNQLKETQETMTAIAKQTKENMDAAQKDVKSGFDDLFSKLSAQFDAAKEAQDNAMEELHKEYKALASEHVESLKNSFTAMQKIVDDFKEEFKKYEEQITKDREFASGVSEAFSKSVSRFDEMVKEFEKLHKTIEDFDKQAKELATQTNLIQNQQNTYEANINQIRKLTAQMEAFVNTMGKIDADLKKWNNN